MANLLHIQNNERIKRADIPHLDFDSFRQELLELASSGGQVVQFFAYEDQGTSKLLAVMRHNDKLSVGGCDAPGVQFPSLTAESEKFHMFEREIGEQYGLKAEGHPWLKMVRYHENYSSKEDVFGNDYSEDIPGNYPPCHWPPA